jgi:hypothetical protein
MKAINLTDENVNDLQKQMEEMQKYNPGLQWEFYNQSNKEPTDIEIKLDRIQADLTTLKAKIDLIFGSAVLINGRFQELSNHQNQER